MTLFHGDKNLHMPDVHAEWDDEARRWAVDVAGKAASEFEKVCADYGFARVDAKPKADGKSGGKAENVDADSATD